MIYSANQLTGFYMMAILAFNELKVNTLDSIEFRRPFSMPREKNEDLEEAFQTFQIFFIFYTLGVKSYSNRIVWNIDAIRNIPV